MDIMRSKKLVYKLFLRGCRTPEGLTVKLPAVPYCARCGGRVRDAVSDPEPKPPHPAPFWPKKPALPRPKIWNVDTEPKAPHPAPSWRKVRKVDNGFTVNFDLHGKRGDVGPHSTREEAVRAFCAVTWAVRGPHQEQWHPAAKRLTAFAADAFTLAELRAAAARAALPLHAEWLSRDLQHTAPARVDKGSTPKPPRV